MILAVDFDDTLHDLRHVQEDHRMGIPEPGAVEALNNLVSEGHTIIIFTARNVQNPNAKKAVADWLDYFKIPFTDITNIKSPRFDVIIDDRALRFDTWAQTLDRLTALQNIDTIHS